jgi:hypothetical protein
MPVHKLKANKDAWKQCSIENKQHQEEERRINKQAETAKRKSERTWINTLAHPVIAQPSFLPGTLITPLYSTNLLRTQLSTDVILKKTVLLVESKLIGIIIHFKIFSSFYFRKPIWNPMIMMFNFVPSAPTVM